MTYSSAFDFYAEFDKHAQEFRTAATFEEFCALVGGKLWEHLSIYKWVPAVFATAKAGKRTYRALELPTASKFADLFTSAVLCTVEPQRNTQPKRHVFLGGEASFSAHLGGTRGWSTTQPDMRSHYGCKFHVTYVLPIPSLSFATSFEAIRGDDGILVVSRVGSIETHWIALLDPAESIEPMFDEKTRALLARERAAAVAAWGEGEGEL